MLNYAVVRQWDSGDIRHTLEPRDVMLYALGLGMGRDPLDREQLRFVTENQLQALPTLGAVLAYPGFWMRDAPGVGIDAVRLVHGEQSMWFDHPLPSEGTVTGRSRVVRVVDKGPDKGALVHVEKVIRDESGLTLSRIESVVFCRGDGGFSAQGGGDEPAAALPATPSGPPDAVFTFETRPEAALIYRLSGDYNPLHSDPDLAARAGFAQPILHGLNTYGVAAHLLLRHVCQWQVSRLKMLRARFSAPTFPGDVIHLECWKVGPPQDGQWALRARVPKRDATVLSHGQAVCLPA